ncbi:MAG: sugar ABC transporter ATP-binding protein [Microbacterium sp.]
MSGHLARADSRSHSAVGSDPRGVHLRAEGITKRYGGVTALDAVSVDFLRGEIHSLVGENGAGKSTLGKIIAGAAVPDGGRLLLNGVPIQFVSPRQALDHGIALVHQEISLVQRMTVLENMLLGLTGPLVNRRRMLAEFDRVQAETGFAFRPDALAADLPLAEQQKVEIARALARRAELIVFDEPTAPLSADESERLYEIVRRLSERGTTAVFVSHFLQEVLDLSDRVTVLKDGRYVRTGAAEDETAGSLIEGMLGRSLASTFPRKEPAAEDAPVVLSTEGLTRTGAVHGISIEARVGEIVGLAGLVGAGRTEFARMLAGSDRIDAGVLRIDGAEVAIRSVADAIRHGIVYLTESRKDLGVLLERSARENLTLSTLRLFTTAGVVDARAEREAVNRAIAEIDLRPADPSMPVGLFSGGNQQKVLLGRCLMAGPRVLILDEPTRGVDVGAKHSLYELIIAAARRGTAVIVISSDLEEVIGLAHRIYVMHRGSVRAEFDGDAEDGAILSAAFGRDDECEETA